MKKALLTFAIAALAIFALVGCNPIDGAGSVDATVRFEDAFKAALSASEINQTISVTASGFEGEIYRLDKTFTQTEQGYHASGEEFKLNKVESGASPSTTVTIDEDLQKPEVFTNSISLSIDSFKPGFVLGGNKLTAQVLDDKVDEVFALEAGHAPISDLKLEIEIMGNNVSKMTADFVSGTYSVKIVLTFKYSQAA